MRTENEPDSIGEPGTHKRGFKGRNFVRVILRRYSIYPTTTLISTIYSLSTNASKSLDQHGKYECERRR